MIFAGACLIGLLIMGMGAGHAYLVWRAEPPGELDEAPPVQCELCPHEAVIYQGNEDGGGICLCWACHEENVELKGKGVKG